MLLCKNELDAQLRLLLADYNSAVQRAINFLVAANGGSAVAMLGFIGASETISSNPNAWYTLAVFVIGLVAVSLVILGAYEQTRATVFTFSAAYKSFFAGQMELEGIFEAVSRQNRASWLRWPGYLSFGCWLCGTAFAGWKLVAPYIGDVGSAPLA